MPMFTIDFLTRLKDELPRGAQARVARKHKVSRATVTYVLAGELVNVKIIEDLIEERNDFQLQQARARAIEEKMGTDE